MIERKPWLQSYPPLAVWWGQMLRQDLLRRRRAQAEDLSKISIHSAYVGAAKRFKEGETQEKAALSIQCMVRRTKACNRMQKLKAARCIHPCKGRMQQGLAISPKKLKWGTILWIAALAADLPFILCSRTLSILWVRRVFVLETSFVFVLSPKAFGLLVHFSLSLMNH